jgi:hypothetical protein
MIEMVTRDQNQSGSKDVAAFELTKAPELTNPYAGFRTRAVAGKNDDVQEMRMEVKPPSLGQRISTVAWTAVNAGAIVTIAKHYDRIESFVLTWGEALFRGIGLI